MSSNRFNAEITAQNFLIVLGLVLFAAAIGMMVGGGRHLDPESMLYVGLLVTPICFCTWMCALHITNFWKEGLAEARATGYGACFITKKTLRIDFSGDRLNGYWSLFLYFMVFLSRMSKPFKWAGIFTTDLRLVCRQLFVILFAVLTCLYINRADINHTVYQALIIAIIFIEVVLLNGFHNLKFHKSDYRQVLISPTQVARAFFRLDYDLFRDEDRIAGHIVVDDEVMVSPYEDEASVTGWPAVEDCK